MSVHIFGIRHHGPGSARSLRRALEQLQPDIVLLEGPPDAADVLALAAHEQMQPPVALLIYVPTEPRRAVYYPFAAFSPEWQAIQYGVSQSVPVRFMDLPHTHQLAMQPSAEQPPATADEPADDQQPTANDELTDEPTVDVPSTTDELPSTTDELPSTTDELPSANDELSPRQDPLGWLARAAGYSDGERWWEHMVEQRRDGADMFEAILEAMAALREASPPETDPVEQQREAWMRQTIRAAQKEGFSRIAVVCGAWHGPALVDLGGSKADAALLKGLPKVKVQATWAPWTYGRLAYSSGYGAGITSPGWYHHLWHTPDSVGPYWMTDVARLLREQDLDASAAHVIEAVRLSETLAALRDRPLPGLDEMNEAARAVFCLGDDAPMRLIHDKLIVSERLGHVPDETPMVPLQVDLQKEQKRLRLPADPAHRDYDLDLRKPNDLDRSHLLHRLGLLGVGWGELQRSGGKGTFHEIWRLQWQPELTIAVIEASMWGNTLLDAATAFARSAAKDAPDLPTLTALVHRALLAELPDAVPYLMGRVEAEAALASDVAHLMDALPPLANILRYGNVRRTDTSAVTHVVDGLAARICIGLPGACASLNDDAAEAMFKRIQATHAALGLLQNTEHLAMWQAALRQVADGQSTHGLVAGRCCRLLLDAGGLSAEAAAQRLSLALSTASQPAQAAAWVEGMLRESGALLLHDDALWQIVDGWLAELGAEPFQHILPLLRRTFATFAPPERRQMGERAKAGRARGAHVAGSQPFHTERAEATLPLLAQLLGLTQER